MKERDNFNYHEAFSRNIGWISEEEQNILRSKRVAIAGLGGVGGSYLLTLARLGIGSFNLSDFDSFEIANFNRQAGATLSSLGKPKLDILSHMARDINPELHLRRFDEGVNGANIFDFLDGADIYIDGLDFYAMEARRTVFSACRKLEIPAVTAAPFGMGAALLNFIPGQMSFEDYFHLEGQSEEEQILRFIFGLAPRVVQYAYIVEPKSIDFGKRRGPSLPMACEMCAGIVGTQALKILLRRGKVMAAPHSIEYDAYGNRLVHTWRPWGNRNILQRMSLAFARRQVRVKKVQSVKHDQEQEQEIEASVIEKILDQARWSPSGDNTQPWRFEIREPDLIIVLGNDTRDHCVYDLQGHASQLSLGGLLETIEIAASAHGQRVTIKRVEEMPETHPTFEVELCTDPDLTPDRLNPYIRKRAVQRRAMNTRALTPSERAELEAAIPSGFSVHWFEGVAQRTQAARLTWKSAGLRLRLPEAYRVHRDVIDWDNNDLFSVDRIPARAVGLDPLTLTLTRWVMRRWERVKFMNRYLGGTVIPRLELELLPGLRCAAHFVLLAEHPPQNVDDYVTAGGAMQRFWLTAARLGLCIQPEMTPLIFHEYINNKINFSSDDAMTRRAQEVSKYLKQLIGVRESERAVFMGRIGAGPPSKARSTRLPLNELIKCEHEER